MLKIFHKPTPSRDTPFIEPPALFYQAVANSFFILCRLKTRKSDLHGGHVIPVVDKGPVIQPRLCCVRNLLLHNGLRVAVNPDIVVPHQLRKPW